MSSYKLKSDTRCNKYLNVYFDMTVYGLNIYNMRQHFYCRLWFYSLNFLGILFFSMSLGGVECVCTSDSGYKVYFNIFGTFKVLQ